MWILWKLRWWELLKIWKMWDVYEIRKNMECSVLVMVKNSKPFKMNKVSEVKKCASVA